MNRHLHNPPGKSPKEIRANILAAGAHECVADNAYHDAQRKKNGRVHEGTGRWRNGFSDIETFGRRWRRDRGLGFPLAWGIRGTDRQPSKRQIEHGIAQLSHYGRRPLLKAAYADFADRVVRVVASLLFGYKGEKPED